MTTFIASPLTFQHHGHAIIQPASTKRQGPSDDDWERLRPVIKALYIDEDCTLTAVMNIMVLEHGHKATKKMYKLRFTKWEFDKHNRKSDMAFLVRKKTARDADGKKSAFIVRSKEISSQEIDRYAKRKRAFDAAFEEAPADQATPMHILCFTPPDSPYPDEVQDTSMVLASQSTAAADGATTSIRLGKRRRSRSPSPVTPNLLLTQRDYRRIRTWAQSPSASYVVSLPDILRRPEMLFGDISSYIRGSISNGTWYLDGLGILWNSQRETVDPSDFLNLCIEATECFKLARAFRGRRLLSKAFSLLLALFREGHPRLLEFLVDSLLRLREEGFVGISALVQNHIAELARAILPEQHIWRRICISISYSDRDHAELLTRSWRCLADAFAHASGRFSYVGVTNEADLIDHLYGRTDPRRTEKLLRELLANYEQATRGLDTTDLYIVYRLTEVILRQGRFSEVELLVEHALLRYREAGWFSRTREGELMEMLSWAQYKSFKDDLAEESIRSAMALYVEAYGGGNPDFIRCCRRLEDWLRKWGREAEADQLYAKIDEAIGPDDLEVDTAASSPT